MKQLKNIPFLFTVLAFFVITASCSKDDLLDNEKSSKIKIVANDVINETIHPNGFYVLNEDWFGHEKGSINFFEKGTEGYINHYRAYQNANNNEMLGVTSQHGAIWGDNIYMLSKQGNRLVVADAETLVQKKVFTDIGGDGRFFLGITDNTAYISHSNGIRAFNLKELTLGDAIPNVEGEIGNMCYAEGKIYAVSRKTLYIINERSKEIIKQIEGSFSSVVRSKDGTVWVAEKSHFIKINPVTNEESFMDYPGGIAVPDQWFAWNAGPLCASNQTNTIYWNKKGGMFGGSTLVVKYDIDKNEADTEFFPLGRDEAGKKLEFYAAGLRVDPITDNLVFTVRRQGFGVNFSYNWIYIVNNKGEVLEKIVLKGGTEASANYGTSSTTDDNYYWFPALPIFKDCNKPQILINQVILFPHQTKEINLNDCIIDKDNLNVKIIKSFSINKNSIVDCSLNNNILTINSADELGEIKATISAISNGCKVEKEIAIQVVKDESYLIK